MPPTPPANPPFVILTCALLLAGCSLPSPRLEVGGPARATARLPEAGERSVDLRAYYGIPILQKSFFWDGNGEDDDAGFKARHFWHLTDNFALGAGLTAAVFFQNGPDSFAGEAEAIGRYYVYRSDVIGVFAELTGGWLQATRGTPTGGTEWNMTFSFGPGVEVPLAERTNLVTGLTYHHISNALGRQSDRNPSQNEAQLWMGLTFVF